MPKQVCLEAGCAGFGTDRGRCPEHARKRRAELKRRTVGAKVYSSKRWRTFRRKVLGRDRYTCAGCLRFGNEVDHIVPIVAGGKVYSLANCQTLCKRCHSRKTLDEVRTG